MVSVLLIILKIIGITLLIIIGLILLLLLMVFFVPVRYKAEGEYEKAFLCKAKVTWLLHFISINIDVGENVNTSIRILGIPLSLFKKKKEDKKNVEELSTSKGLKKVTVEKQNDLDIQTPLSEDVIQVDDSNEYKVEQSCFVDDKRVENEADNEPIKQSLFDKCKNKVLGVIVKIKDIWNKIKNILTKIKDFFCGLKEKKETVKRYLKILKSDMAKEAFAVCRTTLFTILKHILPGKMLVNIHFGMEDPANTGYMLGVYSVLPTFIGERFVLYPDFKNTLFRCDFQLKGRIRMWTLLRQVLQILFDENCKKFYHILKKEISNESE